jgi:putative ABC transport system permease protein
MQVRRFTDGVLRVLFPPEQAEAIAGDLEESARGIAAREGHGRAAWWHLRQLLSIVLAHTFRRQAPADVPPQGRTFMRGIRQDLGYAVRALGRQTGFTLTVVLMLALGIGANVAIFSLVNAVLMRPLPFSAPERLMLVHLLGPDRESPGTYRRMIWSYPKYEVFRDNQHAFASTAAFGSFTWNVTGSATPERVTGEMVAASYFATLGVRPLSGRIFSPEETSTAGSTPLALLSDGIWRRRYGAAADAVGRTIGLNGIAYTIVGILPAHFRGITGQADIWVPVTTMPPELLQEKWNHSYTVVARLKSDISETQADAETRTLGASIDRLFPDPGQSGMRYGATAVPLDAHRADPLTRRSILLLLAAVVAVLLIVCINIANLMLVRALGRQREVAIRLAVGASRWRIVRQLMTESLVLSMAGALAGLAVAYALVSLGASMMPDLRMVLPRGDAAGLTRVALDGVSLDSGGLLFTLAVTIVTAMLFGLGPAWRASRRDLAEAMKTGGGGAVSAPRRGVAVRNVMVVGEIALALVLLTAGGLLIKSVIRLQATELGFEPAGLIAVRIALPGPKYTPRRATQFLEDVLSRLAARGEVASVAYGSCPPVSGGCNSTTATIPGGAAVAKGSEPLVGVIWASPSYFDAMRVRLVTGRLPSPADRADHPKVVVVNETAARQFFGSGDPIGRRIAIGQGGFGDGAEIVGVVGDVRYGAVETPVTPDVYLPLLQSTRMSGYLFIRGKVSDEVLVGAVRAELQALDPDLPLTDIKTMERRFDDATWRTRVSAWLLGSFALLALLLAALGVYGVITQGVAQRTREIGVRLAMGATRDDILRLVIGRALSLAIAGVALGIAIAVPSMRLLTALLYRVQPSDPVVLGTLAATLLAVALLAGYVPARRATRVDPLRTLRAE